MTLVDLSIWFLVLVLVFLLRSGIIHASAKFLLPDDPGPLKAFHLAGIGMLLDIVATFIPFGGPISIALFIAYASKIYETDRLAGMSIAALAGIAGFVIFNLLKTGLLGMV
ncbi:MAG: hypothetical protein ABEJ75_03505 [Candidatus Nanohaloarchaea archaeon]